MSQRKRKCWMMVHSSRGPDQTRSKGAANRPTQARLSGKQHLHGTHPGLADLIFLAADSVAPQQARGRMHLSGDHLRRRPLPHHPHHLVMGLFQSLLPSRPNHCPHGRLDHCLLRPLPTHPIPIHDRLLDRLHSHRPRHQPAQSQTTRGVHHPRVRLHVLCHHLRGPGIHAAVLGCVGLPPPLLRLKISQVLFGILPR